MITFSDNKFVDAKIKLLFLICAGCFTSLVLAALKPIEIDTMPLFVKSYLFIGGIVFGGFVVSLYHLIYHGMVINNNISNLYL